MPKSIQEVFDSFETHISIPNADDMWHTNPDEAQKQIAGPFGPREPGLYHPIVIKWIEKGRGFGEYVFWQENGKIYCQNECDSKETVKRILCHMVDQAEFTDN